MKWRKILDVAIAGHIIGKQRHRCKGNIAYTPQETRQAENTVAALCLSSLGPEAAALLPLSPKAELKLVVAGYYHGKRRPDGSNLLKLVEDALQGRFYPNDKAIVDGRYLIYNADKNQEGIEIKLWAR